MEGNRNPPDNPPDTRYPGDKRAVLLRHGPLNNNRSNFQPRFEVRPRPERRKIQLEDELYVF